MLCVYKKKLNKTKLFLSLVRHANKALLTGRVRHFQFLLVASDQSRNDVRNDWKKRPLQGVLLSVSFFLFFHFFPRNNGDYDRKLMYVSAGQRVLGKEYRLVAYKRRKRYGMVYQKCPALHPGSNYSREASYTRQSLFFFKYEGKRAKNKRHDSSFTVVMDSW